MGQNETQSWAHIDNSRLISLCVVLQPPSFLESCALPFTLHRSRPLTTALSSFVGHWLQRHKLIWATSGLSTQTLRKQRFWSVLFLESGDIVRHWVEPKGKPLDPHAGGYRRPASSPPAKCRMRSVRSGSARLGCRAKTRTFCLGCLQFVFPWFRLGATVVSGECSGQVFACVG